MLQNMNRSDIDEVWDEMVTHWSMREEYIAELSATLHAVEKERANLVSKI